VEPICSDFEAKSLSLLMYQGIATVSAQMASGITSKSKPLRPLASSLLAQEALPEQTLQSLQVLVSVVEVEPSKLPAN
jgi:hypothetical protein